MGEFVLDVGFISQALLNPLEDEKCSQLHKGSCNLKAVEQFGNGCKSMFKMYLLVHIIPLLTVKRKRLIKKYPLCLPSPVEEIRKLIVGFIKSLLFSGGYSMLVRRTICFCTEHFSYKYCNNYEIQIAQRLLDSWQE